MSIKFNQPYYNQATIDNINSVFAEGVVSGNGKYTDLCHSWFEANLGVQKALLTHSCTAALEMAAILLNIQAGDEVIMPSYTFVSTANAFVLRGGVPVFIDIRADNYNMDETLIKAAITSKTKAIVVVHYAGVACDMDTILEIAAKYNLPVVEDAAQGLGAHYKGKSIGSIGDMSTLSFHETKNIISGEGGALLINNQKYIERAEFIRDKGTNRSKFFRGQVDKYTWVDIGSSYLPSDIIAAYLYSGLVRADEIMAKRIHIWNKYNSAFSEFSRQGLIKTPVINEFAKHNAHMFYIVFKNLDIRSRFIAYMKQHNIMTPFHYVPLHSSPAGKRFGRHAESMNTTDRVSSSLVRLPLFYDLTDGDVRQVIAVTTKFLSELKL